MIIDALAHAAGIYGDPQSIAASARARDIEKTVLCPSPKNDSRLEFFADEAERM